MRSREGRVRLEKKSAPSYTGGLVGGIDRVQHRVPVPSARVAALATHSHCADSLYIMYTLMPCIYIIYIPARQ